MKQDTIKICGLKKLDEAEMVASYFPNYMGFVFHRPSPRYIAPRDFYEISDSLRVCFGSDCPQFVAVLVNPTEGFLEKISQYIDVFQFHGDETPEFCETIQKKYPTKKIWKAVKIKGQGDDASKKEEVEKVFEYSSLDGILLDSSSENVEGGSGNRIPKEMFPAIEAMKKEQSQKTPEQILLIAGGVTAENYQSILKKTGADGVDLSSSLESEKGNKSEKKVARLMCES